VGQNKNGGTKWLDKCDSFVKKAAKFVKMMQWNDWQI